MQLGFVSAILPNLSLEEVLAFAADEGFACVELMCWPPGKAERRYAGVTHVDVTGLARRRGRPDPQHPGHDARRADQRPGLLPQPARRPIPTSRGTIAGAHPEGDRRGRGAGRRRGQHLRRPRLAQVGRRQLAAASSRSGRPLVQFAEDRRRADRHRELPDAVHDATNGRAARTWRHCPADLAADVRGDPQPDFGLNYDPSHLVWQHIDYVEPLSRVRPPDLPRPRQGRADRPRAALRRGHPGGLEFTRPSCPAWATSTGAASSPP